MAVQTETISRTKLIRTIIVGASFLVVVVLLLIWLAGGFHRKIDRSPSQSVASASGQVESVGTMETVPVVSGG